MENFDFDKFEEKAIQNLKDGQGLLGKEGVLTPLLKRFLEKALEEELEHHLGEEERGRGNRRNGSGGKKIKTSSGPMGLKTPRDRQGSFEPQIVGKRQVYLGDDLEEKIIKLYARGMSYTDIQAHLSEIYDLEVSSGKLSQITGPRRLIKSFQNWKPGVAAHWKGYIRLSTWMLSISRSEKTAGWLVKRCTMCLLSEWTDTKSYWACI